MGTKLTLRMDEDIIRLAKDYSSDVGKSLSQLVADYFATLTRNREIRELRKDELPPLVQELKGALSGTSISEAEYRRHLEEKHG